MSTNSVPIPPRSGSGSVSVSGSVSDSVSVSDSGPDTGPDSDSDSGDVRAWLSDDAAAWTGARPGSWARPFWSVLALLVTVVAAIVTEPAPVCSDVAPCGTDWVGMAQVGLAVGLLYWFARLPELALAAAPVLAVIVAWEELSSDGWVSRAANLAVIAALGLGSAASWARLAARRKQRRLVDRVDAAQGRRLEFAGPVGRGTIPVVAGLLLCAVAVGAIVTGLRAVHGDEQQAARATRTEAEVTGRTDLSLRVRTDDGRRISVDALFPEDYRLGTRVVVLEDEKWRRLVAEPYDALGWQLLGLAGGLPGLSLLTTGLLARRRGTALRRGPVPALRVLERLDEEGRTWVYAADDPAGSTPLLVCACVPVSRDVEERVGADLHEAVMLGAPYDGAELAFVSRAVRAATAAEGTTEGPLLVTRTFTPARVPPTGKGRPQGA
ncbi:hypothetical protein [Streptomyces sp. NPDC056169]|uniref:hypothetical protein n=1 Tax=Streptomyces sp. NPDC056169 TaxID=3345734 RepID=UPI0035E0271B